LKKLFVLLVTLILCTSTIVGCSTPSNQTGSTTSSQSTTSASGWVSQMNPGFYQGLELDTVWGTSSSDVFTVGTYGTIIHYNGKSWSKMTSGTTDDLFGIWGSSPSDVYACGTNGIILHYDGKTWSQMASNSAAIFTYIWGSSSSDIFAVATLGAIQHYDGKTWSSMTISIPVNWFLSVWGTSSSDVFAMGGRRHHMALLEITAEAAASLA